MSTINLYTVEDNEGNEATATPYDQDEYQLAKDHARRIGGKTICHEYEWNDSYPVDDFTTADDEAGDYSEDE